MAHSILPIVFSFVVHVSGQDLFIPTLQESDGPSTNPMKMPSVLPKNAAVPGTGYPMTGLKLNGPGESTGLCGPGDHKDDCQALVDFWRATGSFPDPVWAKGTSYCGWPGITCRSDGRVKELDFCGASKRCPEECPQAGGTLPESLSLLQGLRVLALTQLGLTGPVPASLGSLPEIFLLGLDFNGLTGTIPASLGSLSTLQVLTMANNKLTGTVPDSLGKLKNLTTLELDSNQITEFPNSICLLTSGYPNNGLLRDCRLGSNPLKKPCPPCAKDKCETFDQCD